jgi:hypothetical protein
MVAIWLRGFLLRRQITDRKYRLALRAAATKSASRSLRRVADLHLNIKYYIITAHRLPAAAAAPPDRALVVGMCECGGGWWWVAVVVVTAQAHRPAIPNPRVQ